MAGIRQAAAASRPVVRKKSCPSCGAPLVDDISVYCNVCGADVRRPAPVPPARETLPPAIERTRPAPPAPVRETIPPSPVKTGPVTPAGNVPDEGRDVPGQKKSRKSLLKWGLVAIAVVIFLAVIAAFITGMIPGIGQSPEETPAPDDIPSTVLPTRTIAPELTTAPAKATTMPPTTAVTANIFTNVTANATATVTT
ncbi:MAG: hypothetical protein LUQ35_04560, partial [Methanoregula sp.]|nr:hypothetical protein [Methanoregula sp.]